MATFVIREFRSRKIRLSPANSDLPADFVPTQKRQRQSQIDALIGAETPCLAAVQGAREPLHAKANFEIVPTDRRKRNQAASIAGTIGVATSAVTQCSIDENFVPDLLVDRLLACRQGGLANLQVHRMVGNLCRLTVLNGFGMCVHSALVVGRMNVTAVSVYRPSRACWAKPSRREVLTMV